MPSAGDVERFAYCAHNWWLARGGTHGNGEGSRRGVEVHKRKGRALREAQEQEREYRRAVRWSFRLLMVTASAVLLTLETLYFRATPQGTILLATTLVLVMASLGLLILASTAERRARAIQRQQGIMPGALEGDGMDGGGDGLLTDPEWNLRGTPDYVLDTEEGPVPVEVKTGKTPPAPHDSHVMQVACYLRLLEARDGKPPAYGLVSYPRGVFTVHWDDASRARLKALLDRMKAAEEAGSADRDHEHAGRCRGCARRDACEQKLA